MEGPVGERYGAQGEVVLAGRGEEATSQTAATRMTTSQSAAPV